MSNGRNSNELFIHHETVSAALGDPDNGVGNYDVIETRDGFVVFEQSLALGTFGSLRSAVAAARKHADEFDRQQRAERKRKRDLASLEGRNISVGTYVTLPLSSLTAEVIALLEAHRDTLENRGLPANTTEAWLDDFIVSPFRYGLWVRQLVTPTPHKAPACLARCLSIAKEHGAQWILFDIETA